MVDIKVVKQAMAAQIGKLAYPALRSLPDLEDQINPPVGIVLPARQYITYGRTLQGATGFLGASGTESMSPTDFGLDYFIILSKASTIERVEGNLDLWLGFESDATAVSVPAAVAADPTLGGTVAWCIPTTADAPGPVEWNSLQYFGARIHFQLSAQ